ncbi:Histone-lysine N-methyltransferase 2A [Araneus ventricosus]|uniref:Histone-lysine N-methyltransferase trithorax n=1 Tax=Araneus ventricosus TaxID=182803 RepID=A0A4Y2AXJ5_ARAVE|nr:Histone-lysine N-methyltransferase 2A [Araneus ventricosus]
MARLRFPGRPGQRIGKNYVKYVYDDVKLNAEICNPAFHKIEVGLKLFHDLFGYSDEEEDFEGFTLEDIAQAEATVAIKLKQKEAIQRFLDSSNELSSPPTSEIDRLLSSSDSDTSTYSVRRERGMRNIVRKSYDKMIKEGLSKSNVHSNNTVYVEKTPQSSKPKSFAKQNAPLEARLRSESPVEQTNSVNICKSKNDTQVDSNLPSDNKVSGKTSIVKHLLEKAKNQVKTRRRRRRNMRPTVQKKFRNRYIYPSKCKYSNLRKKLPTTEEDGSLKNKLRKKSLKSLEHPVSKNDLGLESNSPVKLEKGTLKGKPKRSFPRRKRFVLPSMSARSSRKIIPRKRYLDEYELPFKKAVDEDSQCSRSSLSGSSETISAMDGGSSPEDTQMEDSRYSKKLQKKVGLLDRPLVVEGKRQWKPSLKVQMKLSEMNYEFGLKKNDDSSGTGTSSGSFKDIIKPDMVSKYAEKMAQKPKDRPFKILESFKKSSLHSVKSEPEKADYSSDNMDDDKKPEDKLEKVAAKIEKLLKSQWEGRLKESSLQSSVKMPTKLESSVAQWKSEQQQRTSSQRRTKNIIRKARLQLKKKNLNLRTRKSDKDTPVSNDSLKNNEVIKSEPGLSENAANTKLPFVDVPVDVPSKSLSSSAVVNAVDSAVKCIVCGFSKTSAHNDGLSCGACSRFFDSFAKTPKQYFCTKDGNCVIDGVKDSASRKLVNTRCKACWLKLCMEKFPVSSALRDQLIKYVPRLDAPPHNPLLIVENIEPTEPIEEGIVRGPRIKHVCRRAAVVLGLPRATFPEPSESKESFNLSALPQEEKQKILETVPAEEKVITADSVASTSEIKPLQSSSRASKQQVKKKSHKDFKVKNRVHLDLLKKSSLLIHKEQKRRKLLMKKSMKHMHKHSFKKSLKVGRKSEMKKTLKFSYKSAVKTSLKTSPKIVSTRLLRTKKFRKVRCKQCEGCLAEDCGECAHCLDKKKFGGPNLIKQACKYRRCLRPIIPASDKTSKLSQHENDKGKPSGGHSSFGGDGPSGIGLSLSSSSSSPTSPDGSSCGSSCSSSSSSSSSGSSGSSSSSSSSRSSTSTSSSSSSSDNISVPHSNMLPDSCANVSFMQNIISEPVILQESECTDNNVVTNPIFQEQGFNGEHYMISHSLQELVSNSLASPQQKLLYSNQLLDGPMYRETGDTILYEDSSSIIELKNASYAPSLYYGASRGDNEESVSYSSHTGSKNQNSRQGNSDSRRPHYSKDQDQYGSAGSGGQESNGDDDDEDDDEGKRKKNHIYADYWDDYDFERISSQGFALISSQQIPLPCVCYLCGSAGEEKLIFCVLCCEPYHTFCLPEDDVPHEENLENWCCKRCQCCAVCGLKQNLLKCKKCQCTYHAECLTPHYPTKPSRKKRIWMCPKCVKCKSCGTTSPASSSGVLWNFDLLLCQPCAKLTDKGNYCPVCHKCYEENDYESKMVQCYKCNRWVHATCDNITDEGYEILSCLPETVVYTCIGCTIETTPLWKKAIKEYLKHGLKSVLNSLLTARCARHLIRQVDSSPSYLKPPNSQLENNKTTDLDKSNFILHTQTDLQSDKSSSLNSEEKCDRIAVAETVSSLVDTVHLHSSDEEKAGDPLQNCPGLKNISSKEICDVENNTLQSSMKDSTYPNNKDIQKFPDPDLLVVKANLDKGKYKTIASFFDDVIEIIESGNDMGMKHHTNASKAVLIKQTEKIFPWFKVPSAKIWKSKCDLPEGMLPNAVLPPYPDHTYAQYLEMITIFPPLNLKSEPPPPDNRTCVLCSYSGDSQPKKCGRLLYCGQDEWIHVNCAMWSAEVFQQQDGSLRNVHPAISRGRLMHCEFCNQLGATVGCCVRGCPANYHFYCARKDEAILQADKKVFCALHQESVDERVLSEKDFPVKERVYVNQASIPPKWVKKSWEAPMDKDSLHIVIGSLTVNKLGRLTRLSHNKNVLIPVGYECTRIFWSTKNPNLRIKYTCRVTEIKPESTSRQSDALTNTTTVHFPEPSHFESKDVEVPMKTNFAQSKALNMGNSKCKSSEDCNDSNITSIVRKVLRRLIKKVVKKESKTKLFVQCDKKNNNFLELKSCKDHNSEVSRNSSHLNDLRLEKQKIQLPRFNGNRKKYQCDFQEIENCHDCDKDSSSRERAVQNSLSSLEECSDDSEYDKMNYKDSNSDLNDKPDLKDAWQSKCCNDKLRSSLKTYEFKKYRKRIKNLSDQHDMNSDKLFQLLREEKFAKNEYGNICHQYKEISSMSPKIKSLFNSVLPSHSVTETVLPVYGVGAKDPSGITESSGYSSNEDNHLRQPTRQPSLPNQPNEMKCNSAEKSGRLNIASSWEKSLKFNGQKEFHSNLDVLDQKLCDPEFSSSKNERNLSNNIILEKTYSKDKILNGMCQTAGPFKCSKCKRLYRTIESFKKHSDLCNFVIDSSSGDEESDSSMSSEKSSEDDCVVASGKTLEKTREQVLDAMDVDEPYPETACNNKFKDNEQTSENMNNFVNGESSVTCVKNTYDLNKNANDQSFKQKQESFVSNNFHSNENSILNSTDNFSSAPQDSSGSVTEQKMLPTVKEDLVPNAVATNERIFIPPQQSLNSPVTIDCNSLNTQNVMPNVPMEINRVPLVAENVPNVFNCGYSNTLCNNPPNNIMQMPCNTLIIPPTPTPVAQSSPVLSQIAMPQGNFIQPSIDLNQSSQLSYVGSITITNNETMSLAMNVPDQIVPIFPQQDLNFGVIPSPIQMPQPAEIHLSTVNVQHISVQSSFSANTVNQLVFPQQAVPFPQGQVMFVEDPVTHHLSPAQQPSNYVFQVPIEQTQNCAYAAYVPQQEMQPQFLNQFTFQSSTQQISNQQMNNVFQLQNPVPLPLGNLPQLTEMQRPVNNSPVNILPNSHNKFAENSARRVQLAAKQTSQVTQSVVSPSPPNLSSRSSPASDLSSSGRSCVSAITVPSNSNIVDILKKAAEQMLNIKANMSKKESGKSQSDVPEKKTRFAHTRKVAARKAEKLKQKNAVLNGSNASLTSQIKPKSVKLNIIKPTFSIPFVPIPAPAKTVKIPLSKSEEAESPKPPPPPEKTEDTLPSSQPEIPATLESNSDIYCYDDVESEEESPLVRMHLRQMELEGREEPFPKDRPYLLYEIDSEDGLHIQSRNLRDAWLKVYDELQDARIAAHMKQITLAPEDVNGPHMLGLDNPALMYLLEQLPGAECCPDYEFLFHQPAKEVVEIPENATGCARSEGFLGRKESDMFNFLASEHRSRPIFLPPEEEEEGAQKSSRRTNLDLPIAMRFRFLKDVARETVGVYRSSIHGRGLFCKRNIDPGELVIEYAGEVIRSVLTDKRERIYQSKGIGCYMFRIDDDEVVDATMHGNAARFINHSCEPNCFSKVITIDGKKHIVIFALRRIIKGEELTYDYKFPFEDEKIPCHCNSRRCRKYLN